MDEVEELVSRAAVGDADAWSLLVDRYARLIWYIARSAGLEPADASDVSQTTWLRLAEHLGTLREPARVGAWLATTARRESVRVSRLTGRQTIVDPWAELQRIEDGGPDPDAAVITQEETISVQLAVAELSSRCRDLLAGLVRDPPCSYTELSTQMGIPVGSIGPTRARCLDRLRQLLERDGVAADPIGSGRRSR